jgi:Flp pilus assembly pilin Flp
MKRFSEQTGQTTAEYALVLLGAALVAVVLINWAAGDSSPLTAFFNDIIDRIRGLI